MASLDDMLAEDGDEPLPEMGEEPEPDTDEDEFTLHAETFLDDSLPMADRVAALRSAVLAASAPPPDLGLDEGLDLS